MKEDYLSKNYTLEKHLKTLSENDKDYELLYSIWDLNKKNLTNGLNTISSSFPNYSVHDISHSMTIIDNIQCFLGEERIKRLGATDTFLLLMAALTHDIGMILTYKILEEEWDNIRIVICAGFVTTERNADALKKGYLTDYRSKTLTVHEGGVFENCQY